MKESADVSSTFSKRVLTCYCRVPVHCVKISSWHACPGWVVQQNFLQNCLTIWAKLGVMRNFITREKGLDLEIIN